MFCSYFSSVLFFFVSHSFFLISNFVVCSLPHSKFIWNTKIELKLKYVNFFRFWSYVFTVNAYIPIEYSYCFIFGDYCISIETFSLVLNTCTTTVRCSDTTSIIHSIRSSVNFFLLRLCHCFNFVRLFSTKSHCLNIRDKW